ncbi:MAG: hypothetical protein V1898_03480 [Patescibacteria group bacterium]
MLEYGYFRLGYKDFHHCFSRLLMYHNQGEQLKIGDDVIDLSDLALAIYDFAARTQLELLKKMGATPRQPSDSIKIRPIDSPRAVVEEENLIPTTIRAEAHPIFRHADLYSDIIGLVSLNDLRGTFVVPPRHLIRAMVQPERRAECDAVSAQVAPLYDEKRRTQFSDCTSVLSAMVLLHEMAAESSSTAANRPGRLAQEIYNRMTVEACTHLEQRSDVDELFKGVPLPPGLLAVIKEHTPCNSAFKDPRDKLFNNKGFINALNIERQQMKGIVDLIPKEQREPRGEVIQLTFRSK